MTTTPTQDELRIESDGLGMGTVITIGDKQVDNCIGVSWSVDTNTLIAKATLEMDLASVALTAADWDYRKPTIRQRLKALWVVLTLKSYKPEQP